CVALDTKDPFVGRQVWVPSPQLKQASWLSPLSGSENETLIIISSSMDTGSKGPVMSVIPGGLFGTAVFVGVGGIGVFVAVGGIGVLVGVGGIGVFVGVGGIAVNVGVGRTEI
ncbi:MAG: hypothetical protein ACK2U5_20795, partial [Candidatus Promineifilaceae bacterium]